MVETPYRVEIGSQITGTVAEILRVAGSSCGAATR